MEIGMTQNGEIHQSKTDVKFLQKSAKPVGSTLFHSTKIMSILSALLLVSCATAPSGNNFDSPIGEWSERHETSLGSTQSARLTIIDETKGKYPNSIGRVEFYAIDQQGRWKGYWINENESGPSRCSEEKSGSMFWGEQIYQFNEAYNQYTGTYDYCGEGQKFATKGSR
jgi:hypothetical protein